jgi:BirA family transcriptional regulator, biotin operon repressor / biotin---[acetyl-CoA-carboxylase] ligase
MTEYQLFKLLCSNGSIEFAELQIAESWQQKFSSKGLSLKVKNNCLILNEKLSALDIYEIKAFLPDSHKHLSKILKIVYQTTSTNTELHSDNSNQILLTEYQSAGKGRNNRDWVSPVGYNIYLSVKFTNFANDNISFLPIYFSILIAEALTKAGVEGLSIKWPNDLYLHNKKFSGSILDCYSLNSNNTLVFGVGINVSMPVGNIKKIEQDYTSLSQYYNNELINRNYLLSCLLPKLYSCFENYQSSLINEYIKRFNKFNLLVGKELLIKEQKKSYIAKYERLNRDGSLRVKINNQSCDLYAADISVRLSN